MRCISTRRRKQQRPYAIRKPKDYQVKSPGDLVEIDTLDVRPLPGVMVKHFGARDAVSRWDVMNVYTRATAALAASFLDILQERMPFPIKALQVDGGSEFASQFETECQRRGILLFVLPLRSPELNGHVERAHRTHTEEFYEVYERIGHPRSERSSGKVRVDLQSCPPQSGLGLEDPGRVSYRAPSGVSFYQQKICAA